MQALIELKMPIPAPKKRYKKAKGAKKIKKVMNEFKEGSLKSSSGDKVADKKQALAIALSEQRKADKK